MSSMVERVRDAIETELRKRADGDDITPYIDRAARAAIEAMREPSKEMIAAGREAGCFENGVFRLSDDDFQWTFASMITAALEDK